MSIEPTSSPGRQDDSPEEAEPPGSPNSKQRGTELALVLLTVVASGLGSMITANGLSPAAAGIVIVALAAIAVLALWAVYVGRR